MAAVAAHAQVAATVEVVLAPEVVTQEEVEAALVVAAAAEAAVASEDKQKVVKRPPFVCYLILCYLMRGKHILRIKQFVKLFLTEQAML